MAMEYTKKELDDIFERKLIKKKHLNEDGVKGLLTRKYTVEEVEALTEELAAFLDKVLKIERSYYDYIMNTKLIALQVNKKAYDNLIQAIGKTEKVYDSKLNEYNQIKDWVAHKNFDDSERFTDRVHIPVNLFWDYVRDLRGVIFSLYELKSGLRNVMYGLESIKDPAKRKFNHTNN
jgi:hypothetical protein